MRAITLFYVLQMSSALCLIVSADDRFPHSSDPTRTATRVSQMIKVEPFTGMTKGNSIVERLHFDHGPDGEIRQARVNSYNRVVSGSASDPANIRTRGFEPRRKCLQDTDVDEEVPLSLAQIDDESRHDDEIKTYDLTEKILGDDRQIGKVQVALLPRTEFMKESNEPSLMRSVNTKDQKNLKDMKENRTQNSQPLFSAKPEPAKQRSARSVEAYGLPKKTMDSNGQLEREQVGSVPRAEAARQSSNSMLSRTSRSIDTKSRNKLEDLNSQEAEVFQPLFVHRKETSTRRKSGRLLDTYRTPKQRFEKNGWIHRLYESSAPTVGMSRSYRTARSISPESKNGLEDLEGQDAKVFRPLFVYRQQVAARQKRLEEKRKLTQAQRSHSSHVTTKPYVYRRPFY